MDETMMNRITKTITSLRNNNMAAYYVEKKEDVVPLLKTLMNEGETVTHGGSQTLKECGIIDLLNSGAYNYVDRDKAKDRDEAEELMRKAYFADTYLASANAVTEGGLLYNVDGNSNRVSAILYGPKQVVFICGYNKIVRDLDEAVVRLKTVAAPKNTKRLSCETYCAKEGECLAMGRDASYMCDGCKSPQRICCNYVISAHQRHKDRLKVIIVGEKLGY
ncbi:MAG: lactate utilization protein [Ruminococcus sp.]|nr:lactate utilization protein [Ruminococcus sp.]